jgi:hypothetical protein
VPPRATSEPLPEVEVRDLRRVLDEEVGRLPDRCRLPFVLCYVEGKTNEQAARVLGCPKGTVLSRLAHARELLRTRLARRGIGLAAALAVSERLTAAVPAALVAATTRAALLVQQSTSVGTLSAPVRALTEGMVRSMTITRFKLAVALVLTVSLLGSGFGLVAYHAQGADENSLPGKAAAAPGAAQREQPRPVPEKERPRPAEPDRPRGANRATAQDKFRMVIDLLEKDLEKREEKWLAEQVQVQQEVLNADENLRQLERRLALERERERADIKQVEQQIRQWKNGVVVEGKDAREAIVVLEQQLLALDERWKARERVRGPATVNARRDLFVAEARARLVDRQQAADRQRAQEMLDRATRQFDLDQGRSERINQGEADLKRKVDQILQELTEIRRALRHQSAPERRQPEEGDR